MATKSLLVTQSNGKQVEMEVVSEHQVCRLNVSHEQVVARLEIITYMTVRTPNGQLIQIEVVEDEG